MSMRAFSDKFKVAFKSFWSEAQVFDGEKSMGKTLPLILGVITVPEEVMGEDERTREVRPITIDDCTIFLTSLTS